VSYQYQVRNPLDPYPYEQDERSSVLRADVASGSYVFVRDLQGILRVLPDGPHLHPKVMGHGLPATYAGDLNIIKGVITEVTNCSGTFQFDDRDGLRAIAQQLIDLGFVVQEGAIRFYPADGGPIEVLG
jgi:hypothetical protein